MEHEWWLIVVFLLDFSQFSNAESPRSAVGKVWDMEKHTPDLKPEYEC